MAIQISKRLRLRAIILIAASFFVVEIAGILFVSEQHMMIQNIIAYSYFYNFQWDSIHIRSL